jgi:serine/threonine-protein kinase
LSLGLAAEQLYESLPKATRAALGPVPIVLQRLQQDAQGLRSRMEQLSVAQSDEEIGAARERIATQLRETVGALETIRLDLLRLHAGAITAESFTTHLDAAAEVSRQVARLVEANRELGFSGDFPRLAASTPA